MPIETPKKINNNKKSPVVFTRKYDRTEIISIRYLVFDMMMSTLLNVRLLLLCIIKIKIKKKI